MTWNEVYGSLGFESMSTSDDKLEILKSSYNDTGKYIWTLMNVFGQDRKTKRNVLFDGGPLLLWS